MTIEFQPIKVVFLDIDGVLNNDKNLRKRGTVSMDNESCFDPASVAVLAQLIQKSGAKVVLSSMWRFWNTPKEIEAMLETFGVKVDIIDTTTTEHSDHRGEEIAEWLSKHPEVTAFVSLDDDTDVGRCEAVAKNWIQTTYWDGLQEQHLAPALKLLGVEE